MSSSRASVLAWLLVAVWAAPACAGPFVSSTFDTNADGWTSIDNQAGTNPPTEPVWNSTGGNPGGDISLQDVTLSGPNGGVAYFVAPSKYLGAHPEYFNAVLSFDLKESLPDTGPADTDIYLADSSGANQIVLGYHLSTPPSVGVWTDYTVSLNPTGWFLADLLNPGYVGAAPTAAQFQTVLADLQFLYIRGDYFDGLSSGGVNEVVSLDNVTISSTPAPGGLLLGAAGSTLLLVYTRLRTRRKGTVRDSLGG